METVSRIAGKSNNLDMKLTLDVSPPFFLFRMHDSYVDTRARTKCTHTHTHTQQTDQHGFARLAKRHDVLARARVDAQPGSGTVRRAGRSGGGGRVEGRH